MSQSGARAKIYTTGAVFWATLIGGPLAGGFVIGKNYEAFGEQEFANRAYGIGAFMAFLLVAVLFFIPGDVFDAIPHFLIPLAYTAVAYQFATQMQGTEIREYLAHSGAKARFWQIGAVACAALFITFGFAVLLALVFP